MSLDRDVMVGGLAIKVCKVFICNDFVFKRIISKLMLGRGSEGSVGQLLILLSTSQIKQIGH